VARQIALLTNPVSGTGRAPRTAGMVLRRLEDAGLAVRRIESRDAVEARDAARQAVADGMDALVVVGGDGLVHLGVQAVVGSRTALGVVPAGAGNDLARALGIPRSDPERAVDVVVGARTRRVDVGRCGDTSFVTVLAAGFDALVNERANAISHPRGRLRYAFATLAELHALRPLPYALGLDGTMREVEAVLVAVGNGPSYGGGLRVAEGARLDDGLLDVVVIGPVGRLDLVRTYPRLYTGGHTRHPRYERHRVRTVSLASPGVVAYADGERLGPLPVTVEVRPGALEVLVPDE
jgi:diacylglycerol kinase (ATP)